MRERGSENESGRKRTYLNAELCNCKNDATYLLLTAHGVQLFHVNHARSGCQLQFVLFVLFRNQEVFFLCFSFLFGRS